MSAKRSTADASSRVSTLRDRTRAAVKLVSFCRRTAAAAAVRVVDPHQFRTAWTGCRTVTSYMGHCSRFGGSSSAWNVVNCIICVCISVLELMPNPSPHLTASVPAAPRQTRYTPSAPGSVHEFWRYLVWSFRKKFNRSTAVYVEPAPYPLSLLGYLYLPHQYTIIIEIVHKVQHENKSSNRQTWQSLSTNTLNSSGNLISVKQSTTLIRMVSKQQHILQHVNFGLTT